MRYIIIILIGVILAIGIIHYFRGCNKTEQTVIDIQKADTIYRVKIDSIHALRKADLEKMKQDSVKAKVAETVYITEITRLKKKIAEKKEIAMPVIESNQNVRELVNYYDSTVSVLEQRIDTIQQEKALQLIGYSNIIDGYKDEVQAGKDLNKDIQIALDEQLKQNKKLKRRTKILGILIPVALVGGVLLAK